MAQLPTVDDVAQRAGVSRQTVSNVLNSPEIVRETTRLRVQTAITELGYRPHASARRLRTQQSSTIGVRLNPVLNGISGSILDLYLHALGERAEERGMRIMLFTASDIDDEIRHYEELRDGADIDAFVVTATFYDDPRIEWLATQRVPFVAFGRPWGAAHLDDPDRLWVDVDGRAGTRLATEHLVRRGLRRIGYLGWPAGSGTGDDRRQGWRDAMVAAFGSSDAELTSLTHETDEGVRPGRIVIEQLLAHGNAAAEVPIDALVCASDSLALGAMMAVREAGLPHFPIFGFDNTPTAQAVGLSSVDQRLGDVAAGTFELLMGATGRRVLPHGSGSDDDSRHRLITPQLVVRRSSHLELVEEAGGTASGDHDRKEQS